MDAYSSGSYPEAKLVNEQNEYFRPRDVLALDANVPSTENNEMLVWVNVCTNEVQNCRRIAASGAVILIETTDTETSASSGKRAAKDVLMTAKRNVEQERQPFRKLIMYMMCIVPCSRNVSDDLQSVFFQDDSFLDTAFRIT